MGKSNMLHNINKMLRIVLDDGREMTGKLLVYDQHMNVVLSDTVETRPQTRRMREEQVKPTRNLGLLLLRGEHVVSVTVLADAAGSDRGSRSGGDHNDAATATRQASFDAAPRSRKAVAKRARDVDDTTTTNTTASAAAAAGGDATGVGSRS